MPLASSGQRPEEPSQTLQDTGQRHNEDCLAPNGIVLRVSNLAAEGNEPQLRSRKALGGIEWLLVPASAGGAGGERKAGKSREVTRPVLWSLTSAHTSPGPKRSQESL